MASRVVYAVLICALFFGGGRPASAADDVTLRLHWVINGGITAWYLGIERGYFTQEGINLKLVEGKGSAIAAQLVAAKSEVFATADAGSVIQVAAKGGAIRAIFAIQPTSPLGVVFLAESGVKTIKDLEGKRVGLTAGDSLTQLWPAVVAANKLDESKIRLTYMDAQTKPVALMEKRVDAILDSIVDKRAVLENKGFKPGWFMFSDVGVRLVSLVLLTHEDTIKNNPDLVRRFTRAAQKSFTAFLADPKAGVAAAKKARPDLDEKILLDQAIPNAELVRQGGAGRPVGMNNPDDWTDSIALLRSLKVLESDKPATAYYTNDFLPKP